MKSIAKITTSRTFVLLFSAIVYLFFSLGIGCETEPMGCEPANNDPVDPGDQTPKATAWTIMVYGDGDNNLEGALLADVEEMKAGIGEGINLIVLADRISGESSSTSGFGANFTDTRLYRIIPGQAVRIGGSAQLPNITTTSTYEMNMGDAVTLRQFIRFCKANYPADHYALILWNHGSGPSKKKKNMIDVPQQIVGITKAICSDETSNNDILYTAEITEELTEAESVDLLGFDACIMGSIEIAYQYRPGTGDFYADYMVASPANEWGLGWEYEEILKRLRSGGGNNGYSNNVTESGFELYYDPETLTPQQLGEVIVEEYYDSTQDPINFVYYGDVSESQTLSLYDLSHAEDVKDAVDDLAMGLDTLNERTFFENLRGNAELNTTFSLHYFDNSDATNYKTYWCFYPFFDLYDLCERVYLDITYFSPATKGNANLVMDHLKNLIVYSFAGSNYVDESYNGFTGGENGVFIFFPHGDAVNYDPPYRDWRSQWWYNAIDLTGQVAYYGKLLWCIDNAIVNNDNIENWFEMLDAWFDDPAENFGYGYNGYMY